MKNISSFTGWRRVAQGGGVLALVFAASGAAWSACNVTLGTVANNQANLTADCGRDVTIIGINWFNNGNSITGGDVAINPGVTSPIAFIAPIISGLNTFTATGNAGAVGAGTAVTIITPPPQTVTGVANPQLGGSVSCNSPVAIGNTTTCTITTNSGYTLGGVSTSACNGSLSNNVYTTGQITSACTVTATFSSLPAYTVVGSVGSGVGTVTCSSPITSGQTSTCSISAGANYTISGTPSGCGSGNWSGSSTSGTYTTAAITSNCSVTANFSQNATNVTVSTTASPSNGGTVSCSPNPVSAGGTTTCTATPANGWTFASFNGTTCTTGLPFGSQVVATVNSACTVTANFTQQQASQFTLSGQVSPAGAGTASCSSSLVTSGNTATCTFTANQGYTVTGISFNSTCGGSQSNQGSNWVDFTTGPVTSNCTVTATLSSSGGGGGGGTPAACAANEVVGANDIRNPMGIGNVWPANWAQASGELGTTVFFLADNNAFPNGMRMEVHDEGSHGTKEAVISACPHNFTPVDNNAFCRRNNIGLQAVFYVRFGPAQSYYDCALTPGRTYYLNFRDAATPRGTVATKFINWAQ